MDTIMKAIIKFYNNGQPVDKLTYDCYLFWLGYRSNGW